MDYENDYSFATPYFINGEYVLWRGKPGKGKLLTKSDVFMIPFSLFWCGFAVFWVVSTFQNAGFFSVFGIPFVGVGIYIVIGRFFHMAWLRKRTFYVITNHKIIRKQGKKVNVLMGKSMPSYSVITYANGYGSIRFFSPDHSGRTGFNGYVADKNVFSLENIPDVIRVQQILTQISTQ